MGSVFSTVNWSLCAPKSFESSCFSNRHRVVRGVDDLVGHLRLVALGGSLMPRLYTCIQKFSCWLRLKLTGVAGLALTRGQMYVLPITQVALADVVRMTRVHLVGQNQRRCGQLFVVIRRALQARVHRCRRGPDCSRP